MDIIFYSFIIVSVGFIGYAIGNITGWTSGRKAEAKRQAQMLNYVSRGYEPQTRSWAADVEKQELIDKILSFSLEEDSQTGFYRKIETVNAEIICSWCDNPINGNAENLNGYYVHPFCSEQSNGRSHKLKLLKD